MSVISNNLLLSPEGYQISRSVRLRSSASAYFNRTPASAGNRQIMTFSWWMKLGNTAGAVFGAPSTTNPRMQIYYNGPSDGRFELYQSDGGGSQVCYTLTSARYRDPSAWYHFIIAIDTTQATAANRIKWYVNGVQLTAFDTAAYPAQNTNMEWNAAAIHNIGRQPNGGSYFDGYLTEVNFIDGQALTPSSFGETDSITGVWKPKKYAGTYGTNGFYLNFSDPSAATAAAIGKDNSGNGNNWTPNNISVTAGVTYDSMLDVPTLYADGGNGRGNYAVLNAASIGADATLSAGNLQIAYGSGSTIRGTMATFGMSSGKWYWEATITASSLAATGAMIGIVNTPSASAVPEYPGYSANGWGYHGNNGSKYTNASGSSYGATYGVNDVIGVSFDADTRELIFYKNGTSQGVAFTGLAAGDYFPAVGDGSAGNTFTAAFNFGQRPFAFSAPSGFKALNTQNLPEPTIKKGNQYFDVSTWSGSGGASRSITGLSFQPDFVWGKVRNTTYGHMLFDAVRGAGSNKELGTNVTGAEGYATSSQYGYLSAFNSDGFTVTAGTDASIPNAYWNQSGNTYVGWQWKESPSAGFDIVTYTGTGVARTVSHSLGVAPSMMIIKNRARNASWAIYHQSVGATKVLQFDTNAAITDSTSFNNTAPTSSVFSVGTANSVNASTESIVAYLFAEVAGFSKFGSYTGNGSADGPFVFCGFRPAFIMIKRTDSTGNWTIHDNERLGYNGSSASKELYPNLSNAEGSDNMDQLSNGFKLRDTYADVNASGGTYIFMAFAESPFKTSLAR